MSYPTTNVAERIERPSTLTAGEPVIVECVVGQPSHVLRVYMPAVILMPPELDDPGESPDHQARIRFFDGQEASVDNVRLMKQVRVES